MALHYVSADDAEYIDLHNNMSADFIGYTIVLAGVVLNVDTQFFCRVKVGGVYLNADGDYAVFREVPKVPQFATVADVSGNNQEVLKTATEISAIATPGKNIAFAPPYGFSGNRVFGGELTLFDCHNTSKWKTGYARTIGFDPASGWPLAERAYFAVQNTGQIEGFRLIPRTDTGMDPTLIVQGHFALIGIPKA